MGKTIIQTIGPLYGEVVNGTVFGRPNGSIFVPSVNTVKAALVSGFRYIRVYDDGNYVVCNSAGSVPVSYGPNRAQFVAESQDLQNYIVFQVSKSDDFATLEGSVQFPARIFNGTSIYIAKGADLAEIVEGDTYYLRAVLMSAMGDPVAVSEPITIVGVVVS